MTLIEHVYAAVVAAMVGSTPGAPIGWEEMIELVHETECLAKVIYTEASGENSPRLDQMVADVVVGTSLAREVSICDEAQKPGRYSGYLGFREPSNHLEWLAWERSVEAAVTKLTARHQDDWTRGATHFYVPSKASPSWANEMTETVTEGGFRFMREDER